VTGADHPGTHQPTPTLRYGIEAPYVPLALTLAGLASGGLATASPWWLISMVLFLVQAALYLHTTLRGKLQVWDQLLDSLALRGDEVVLDLGCGRGAVLLALARRLPKGRALGIDLWHSRDQSGNTEAMARANAAADGVADVVELHTGDITALPFPDASFDLVTSALAIHNIPRKDGRARAVAESFRVLRPGGQLVLVDIRHTDDYARWLTTLGALKIHTRNLGPRYWYGGPWTAAAAVTATRPESGRLG